MPMLHNLCFAVLEKFAIPVHFIAERLRNSGADNIILIIDACRSNEGRRDGTGIGAEEQQGVITLFSCSPNESSYEIEELERGAFTHVLIESLRLQGEGNCATVERLYKRLRDFVPQLTQQYEKGVQTPYCVIEPLFKNHLILLPRQATLDSDVSALVKDALIAEFEGDFKTAKQLWSNVLMVSPDNSQALAGIKHIDQSSSPKAQPQSTITQKPPKTISPTEPPSGKWKLPDLKPATKNGIIAEFNVATVDTQTQSISIERKQAECRTEEIANGITLDLMVIPGGTFAMGSPKEEGYEHEKLQHHVTVEPFLMGTYPVTQAQWRAVVGLLEFGGNLGAEPSRGRGDSRPVEQVSWNDAVEFCVRLSEQTGREYRLPTEAEWEYACRAGTTTLFHFGNTLTSELANYKATETYGNGPRGTWREQTTNVGSFPANAFGLYDMHGNVLEWCQDHWHRDYEQAPTNGSAWTEGGDVSQRLLRGGSWFASAHHCRSVNRDNNGRGYRNGDVGFRVVCASYWPLR
jgi:formylglycine-generating enzyme required for sulfatase activity